MWIERGRAAGSPTSLTPFPEHGVFASQRATGPAGACPAPDAATPSPPLAPPPHAQFHQDVEYRVYAAGVHVSWVPVCVGPFGLGGGGAPPCRTCWNPCVACRGCRPAVLPLRAGRPAAAPGRSLHRPPSHLCPPAPPPLCANPHSRASQVGVSKWLKKLEQHFYDTGISMDQVRASTLLPWKTGKNPKPWVCGFWRAVCCCSQGRRGGAGRKGSDSAALPTSPCCCSVCKLTRRHITTTATNTARCRPKPAPTLPQPPSPGALGGQPGNARGRRAQGGWVRMVGRIARMHAGSVVAPYRGNGLCTLVAVAGAPIRCAHACMHALQEALLPFPPRISSPTRPA